MKNDLHLCIPPLIPNYVKIHRNCQDKPLPGLSRRYFIELGGQKNPSLFSLTILLNPYIHMCSSILVHPILVNTKELVIDGREVIYEEVALYL